LDAEDMDVGTGTAMEAVTNRRDCTGGGAARAFSSMESGSFYSGRMERPNGDSPTLPPIYLTIKKERERSIVIRNLNGSGITEVDSTNCGASTSTMDQVGSFANAGDKRHNITQHRHDFKNLRNISTSFNIKNFVCNTCTGNGEHKVLCRDVEGEDIGTRLPPVFVLADPPWSRRGGEGECIKVIQIENGRLVELVDVFLELTKGFAVPAGAVLLISSASHMAAVGTAEYAAEFVRARVRVGKTFTNGIRVLHGLPLLLGGTGNTSAIRTMAEIYQWVKQTARVNHDISATRTLWGKLIRTAEHGNDAKHTIRLPISQDTLEMGTYTSSGFSNLITAAGPIEECDEREIIHCLIQELNELFALGLNEDPIVDRFLEDDVFYDAAVEKKLLILIGASHLSNVADKLNTDKWEIVNLCQRGFRVSDASVGELVRKLAADTTIQEYGDVTAIIQLLDNSVFLVGGPGGTRHLPRRDTDGTYHVDGVLHVADKPAVRDLVSKLTPLLKTLGPRVKKIFLSPLTRYWIRPCCSAPDHLTNYSAASYLPNLGVGVYSLREFIRDSLYVRRASNFRVICPNRMLNIRPGITDEEAREAASL
jgi:hypothetical protein